MPGMFENPWVNLGLGLLSANTGREDPMVALGRGGMLGIQNYQLGQRHAAQLEAAKQAAELQKLKLAEAQQRAQNQPQVSALMGRPPEVMGPPTAAGQMELQPGYGVLGGEMTPQQFYAQMSGIPGYQEKAIAGMSGLMTPQTQAPTSLQQNLIAAGLQPGTPAYQQAILERTQKGPLVSITQPGAKLRTMSEEAQLKTIQADIESYAAGRQGAQQNIQAANQGLNLLKNTQTGQWEPMKAKAAKMLGVAPEMVASSEIWNDLSTNQALAKLQSFKGPTTDFEYNVARDAVAKYGKSGFANFVSLTALKRAGIRAQKKPFAYSQWVKKQLAGKVSDDFETWFAKEKDPFPQFDIEQLRKEYDDMMGTGGGVDMNAIDAEMKRRGLL